MGGDTAVRIGVSGNVGQVLDRLAGRLVDYSPAMARIAAEVFEPVIGPAWQRSGLISRSGALRAAISPWSGRFSAGVTVRARGGRYDAGLIFAKSATHTFGAKKWSFKRGYHRRVKGSRKDSTIIRGKRRSPWGDIPARPFFPSDTVFLSQEAKVAEILEEHCRAAAE